MVQKKQTKKLKRLKKTNNMWVDKKTNTNFSVDPEAAGLCCFRFVMIVLKKAAHFSRTC